MLTACDIWPLFAEKGDRVEGKGERIEEMIISLQKGFLDAGLKMSSSSFRQVYLFKCKCKLLVFH